MPKQKKKKKNEIKQNKRNAIFLFKIEEKKNYNLNKKDSKNPKMPKQKNKNKNEIETNEKMKL